MLLRNFFSNKKVFFFLKLDALKPRLDLYSIIQKEIKHSHIAKVEGISRCFLNQSTLPDDNGCFKLITEGINVTVS
jgi:hypothetical protein